MKFLGGGNSQICSIVRYSACSWCSTTKEIGNCLAERLHLAIPYNTTNLGIPPPVKLHCQMTILKTKWADFPLSRSFQDRNQFSNSKASHAFLLQQFWRRFWPIPRNFDERTGDLTVKFLGGRNSQICSIVRYSGPDTGTDRAVRVCHGKLNNVWHRCCQDLRWCVQ